MTLEVKMGNRNNSLARNNLLATVHILKKQYNLLDETYRSILDKEFNAMSSADLDLDEQEKFIHILNFRYNEDYKRGYTKAMTNFMSNVSNLTVLFYQLKEPTPFEVKMFEMLSVSQQKELIQELIAE